MKVEKQPIEKFNNQKLLYYYFIQLETLNAKENLWKNKKISEWAYQEIYNWRNE